MRIEDYLNSDKVDVYEPNVDKLWQGFNEKKQKIKRLQIQWLKGIAVVLLISLFVGALFRQELMLQKQITTLSQINESLKTQENEYVMQVSNKWESYLNMEGNESAATPLLLNELNSLDTLYQKGINDLLNYGYNERLIINLMNTYEKRLRIIEYLILEKQKQRNYENKVQKMDV